MAVTSSYEVHSDRTANISYPQDGKIKKEYKRIYTIITDNSLDDGGVVTTWIRANVADYYYPYVTTNYADYDCQLKTINTSPMADYYMAWKVELAYDNEPYLPATTPLCQPPVWQVSFQKTKEAVFGDINGNPIVNSAGVPIACEREVSLPVISVKWASINLDFLAFSVYADSLNSDAWYGFAPGSLKIEGFTVVQQYDPLRAGQGLSSTGTITAVGLYWEKTVTFALKWDGWDTKLLDAGVMELKNPFDINNPSRWNPILDSHGQPIVSPVPLRNGHQLPIGQPPVYLQFQLYRYIEFAPLIDFPSITCPQANTE